MCTPEMRSIFDTASEMIIDIHDALDIAVATIYIDEDDIVSMEDMSREDLLKLVRRYDTAIDQVHDYVMGKYAVLIKGEWPKSMWEDEEIEDDNKSN